MAIDIMQVLSGIGLFFDVLTKCKVSKHITAVVIPEKCGKSRLSASLEGACVLIDLDEMLKQNRLEIYSKTLKRNDYASLSIQLADDTKELIDKLKKLYKRKKVLLITSRLDLLEMSNLNYTVYVPSNQLFDSIKTGFSPDDQQIANNSRMVLIQTPKHTVYNSFDDLYNLIQNKFNVHRKLF